MQRIVHSSYILFTNAFDQGGVNLKMHICSPVISIQTVDASVLYCLKTFNSNVCTVQYRACETYGKTRSTHLIN